MAVVNESSEDVARAYPREPRDGSRRDIPPLSGRDRISLMGLGVDLFSEAEAVACIADALEHRRGGWVITPNLDQLRAFRRRAELRPMFDEADIVVPDGMPLVWASRLQGTPLPERVAGSELIWALTAEATLMDRTIFLLGAVPEAREMAEQRLRLHYPGVRIAGSYSPPLNFDCDDDEEIRRIDAMLARAQPDIVYVALGSPKQELVISRLRASFPSTWFLGIGISLSFIGGHVARAPDWMMRWGLEWLHRLGQEPRRLARRYLVQGLPFAARLFAGALAGRVLRGPRTIPRRHPIGAPARRPVFTCGALERERVRLLEGVVKEAGADLPNSA